jgi:Tol biopolymer transport system component/serine/threonine protein kinase
MKPSGRWQEVKEVLYPALEMADADRSSFLDEKCGNDAELRREVESLIAAHNEAAERFESPAVELMAPVVSEDLPEGMAGRALGHYEVVGKIGAGGMGEVYLARDSHLDRKVALKILPTFFTQDAGRLRRFQQEARAASALNHPNILTIHEVGHLDSTHYIATEFVDGESLRDRINRASLKTTEALDIAMQIASALAAAHEVGIIHRDIKPENIMLRRDGIVKVVDFGLAKLIPCPTSEPEASTMVNTDEGIVMGTAQYMSPEQARGVTVDARTDLWSLGCVLYEMLAGRSPFEAPTPGDVIVSILEREPPPLTRFAPEIPSELDWIVRKSLRKERDERYQTGKELVSDLRSLKNRLEFETEVERTAPPELHVTGASAKPSGRERVTETAGQSPAHPTSSAEYILTGIKKHKTAAVALPIMGIALASILLYLWSARSPGTTGASLRNTTFLQLTDQPGTEYFPSLSPDGKEFVYAGIESGNLDIYLRKVGGKNPINLTKDSPVSDTQPAFSPDGQRIAFRSEREGGGIFVMGATGENVKRLTNFGFNPVWSPDGTHVACADESIVKPSARTNPNSRVWTIDIATGERRQVTEVDAVSPSWSPDGSRIAYQGRRNATQRDIWTIPAGGGEAIEVTNDEAVDWNPVWAPDGNHLYFVSDRGGSMNLWRAPIEQQTGKVGPLEAVTTPSPYISHLSFSSDGRRMLYAHVISSGNIQRLAFDPVGEKVMGQPVWITQGSRPTFMTDLSPDMEWLAFDTQFDRQDDIFVVKRDGTGLRQLTDDSYKDRAPQWSPDGKLIAFFSDRSGKWDVWIIGADGSGLRQITYATSPAINPIWSPDGTLIAYRNSGEDPAIIEVGKAWQDQTPQTLPPMNDPSGRMIVRSWSPDGRRLAGTPERPDRPPSGILIYTLDSQKYEVLTDSGNGPVWLSDSRRLLFVHQKKLFLIDSLSKRIRELLTVEPHTLAGGVTLSRDNREIYFSLLSEEADIWMMTLE